MKGLLLHIIKYETLVSGALPMHLAEQSSSKTECYKNVLGGFFFLVMRHEERRNPNSIWKLI